ncbi:MAG: gnl 3 [Planctomycetota bacterium]|nr:gnl 3 [Planctomycetota bacterium]
MQRVTSPILAAFALAAIAVNSASAQKATEKKDGKYPTLGTIERLNPKLDALIPKEAAVEQIAEGFDWSEGPVWVAEGSFLLFSDVPKNTVYQWTDSSGITEFLKPSGYTGKEPRGGEPGSNGLTLSPQRRLVLMQHGDRRVAKLDNNRGFTTIVDKYEGKRFNSPNDGVYDSKGNLYFTDPPYGLLKQNDDPAKELDFNGVYRVSADGKLSLLTKEMTYPNGIAISPDEKTLYVANSDPKKAIWKAFPIKDDGMLGEGKVFFDATDKVGKVAGLPDGLKVDKDGNLFATGPGGVLIFAPDGTHLGTIATGQATANCGWGEDGSVLYITADMFIGRLKTSTKGKGY